FPPVSLRCFSRPGPFPLEQQAAGPISSSYSAVNDPLGRGQSLERVAVAAGRVGPCPSAGVAPPAVWCDGAAAKVPEDEKGPGGRAPALVGATSGPGESACGERSRAG